MVELIRWAIAEKDLDGARELLHESVAALEEPEVGREPARIAFLLELDRVAEELGSLEDCKRLRESVLRLRTLLLPADHSDLLTAKQDLAVTRKELGDLHGARALEEEVLEARARLLTPDHPDLLVATQNLAATRYALRDLAGARELFEEVLTARTRLLPPDHPDLLRAKANLAATRYALRDLTGARELFEEVLEAWTRLLPPDHPDLLKAKANLAATRAVLDDTAGARELFEEVLEAWRRLLPPDHPDLLKTKQGLAATRYMLGDLAGAHVLFEEVLQARNRLLRSDHPDLLQAKYNLALTRGELGDLAGARALEEEVLEVRTRLLPAEHPDILKAKQNLAATRKGLGDLAGARELVSSLLDGVRLRARGLRAEAARPAREGARTELHRLSDALFLSAAADPEHSLEPEFFATLEELRLASVATSAAAHALFEHPELDAKAREVAGLRSQINDFVASGPEEGSSAEDWRKELLRLAGERDRVERELRAKLDEARVFVEEIDAAGVGAKLAPNAVAVSYLRYPKQFEKDPESGKTPPHLDSLLAFVVRSGGAVERVELGPAAELEEQVQDWRKSLGKPIERGISAENGEPPEPEIGRALRARVLDPLLSAAGGDVRELHVVLDDFLHLVPLDALPLEGELRVGERHSIHLEPTLARLLVEQRPIPSSGTLVALGGIDFEAEPVVAEKASAESDSSQKAAALPAAATPPVERGGRPEHFEPLRQTRYEVEDVGAQVRELMGCEPLAFTGSAATKTALFAAAPRTRWLHLATHGWFAPETFRSQLDTLAEHSASEPWQRAEETLIGFAPETLCGIALAGANRGRDAVGRVPGILTAEELATFDLRNCELAVLSACETNVGIRRAGQGIQSLQTALHAAGARTAITSLWKVDDAATRRFFELFYTKLWREKLGKADALWQAKMALRAEGHPMCDWAAWVLTGDPD